MQVDDAADVEGDVRTATGQQLALDCIIQKVFEKYSIGIKTTDKIRHAFQTKLWRMGKKYAQLGGTRRKQQIEEWKASSWLFTIDCEEVRKHLLSQKRHLEDELKREVSKRQKVQSEVSQLRKVTKDQKKAIVTLRTGGKKGRGASAKSWGEYSRMQRSRKRILLMGLKRYVMVSVSPRCQFNLLMNPGKLNWLILKREHFLNCRMNMLPNQ